MTPRYRDRIRAELTAERERIVRTLLAALAVLGLVAYVPSAWLGLRVGAYGIVAVDTVAYAILLLTLAFGRGRTTLQSLLLLGTVYGLGLVLSLTLGPIGAGPMWLTVVPAVTAALLDRRATYLSIVVVLMTGIAIGGAHAVGWVTWESPPVGTWLWAVLYGNGLLLGGGVAVAVAALVVRMRTTAERAAHAMEQLDEKHERLLEAHSRAEEEAAERRHVEAQLRQSEKLTAIGTLAAGIAHDFNNLLTPILTAPELLSQDDLPDADRERILAQVEHAAVAGRDLVRRLLSFSRPSAPDREPVPSSRVVHDAIRLLRSSLPAAARFDVHIDPEAGHVLLTPTEVHQVLLNLGTNAHRAMPDGGTLTFRLAEVAGGDVPAWDGTDAPARAIRLTVADEGYGMDPATVARIFDPFYTTDETRGTGLGLATVHRIVTDADGHIACESEPGGGTTFTIHLPVVEACCEARAPGPALARSRRSGVHVLLVDDEEPVRDVSARALRKQGYLVTTAPDAPAALEALEQDAAVDCLITDLHMPGFRGTRLAREVRRKYPGIRIILMTGLLDSDVEQEAQMIGIDHLVAKPFRVEELVDAIDTTLGAPA